MAVTATETALERKEEVVEMLGGKKLLGGSLDSQLNRVAAQGKTLQRGKFEVL